jgi:hypothetical protein
MIRLPEKTIELTFCSQVSFLSNHMMIWFGLTQKQEAKLGFDACTELNGKLFIYQFKASNLTVNGLKRFSLPHNQLIALQSVCGIEKGLVYYVFPMVGNLSELTQYPDIINHSWLMDVAEIPQLSFPTTNKGSHRANGIHYVDISHSVATIHSKPQKVTLHKASDIAKGISEREGLMPLFQGKFEKFDKLRKRIGRKAYGTVFVGVWGQA